MEFVYPAIIHKNDDESYTITYPDLPGCISEGKSLENAMYMAQRALYQWLGYMNDNNQEMPLASPVSDIKIDENEFVNFICVQVKDKHAVKRTVSIPKWMDDKAARAGLSLSRVLQDALSERLA
jgi:predicted RNase H-like HicB family nuclease